MFIAETFVSLQGEGLLAGTPAFFIRTSGCNLRCRWCDTPYSSWRPEGRRVAVELLVEAAVAAGTHYVVITGGEPLLQREFPQLCHELVQRGLHVTVETAGTLAPNFPCHLLSLSPKTANSDPEGAWGQRHKLTRSNLTSLRLLLSQHSQYQLKFVVEGEADMPEVCNLVESLGADPLRVLLMPQGKTAEEVRARATLVAQLCLRYGFRFSPRLHLELFGPGRGV
ncbi:MAG: 7-carboxy-7-deazaguanine synthase QueE [Thermoanaerobaculaceae bacterium]